jgi:hypothetical protein
LFQSLNFLPMICLFSTCANTMCKCAKQFAFPLVLGCAKCRPIYRVCTLHKWAFIRQLSEYKRQLYGKQKSVCGNYPHIAVKNSCFKHLLIKDYTTIYVYCRLNRCFQPSVFRIETIAKSNCANTFFAFLLPIVQTTCATAFFKRSKFTLFKR